MEATQDVVSQITGGTQDESGSSIVKIGLIVLAACGLAFGAKKARDAYVSKLDKEKEEAAADVAAAQLLKRIDVMEGQVEKILGLLTGEESGEEVAA